ncbi:integrase, catalytic region, zinc finger, CCHC-type containing protein [Tanacetum coccineum]
MRMLIHRLKSFSVKVSHVIFFNILNQTNTAKEIWDNVEMLMQGSGRTLQQRKEDLFDEFERFRAIGNEPIHDYWKKVICYNCRGEGHVARQCKEPKRAKDSQYFKDKMLLMEAKEKGATLDAEAEAFLANVECTTPYDQPLAMTTTNIFEVNHEDAYDSDIDEGPNAAAAFMANFHIHKWNQWSKMKGKPGMLDLQVSSLRSSIHDVCSSMKELSPRNSVIGLPANEIASQASTTMQNLLECDREHNKVLELEAEISKQKQLITESEKQIRLQRENDMIRILDAQINILKVLNVGSTEGSCDQQALDTDRIQLKDMITSLRIQLDGLKAENVNLKRRYEELSKSNAYSRSTFTTKINALTAENAKLKTELSGKMSSGFTTSETPKVLASGLNQQFKILSHLQKRAMLGKPTPLPKKKQVTFQEPPRTSNRPTQKPPVQQNKKPNVPVNLSTRTKPATESRKPMPKCHTRNHRILPNKSVNARRAAYHNRKLNVVDHNQFVIRSLKSVNTKTPQAKHSVNHTKKVWKATRNHNVNNDKTSWRANWNRIVEPVTARRNEPALVLVPKLLRSLGSLIANLVIERLVPRGYLVFLNAKALHHKGRTVSDSIAENIDTTTAYNFKTDCSIIPVWFPGDGRAKGRGDEDWGRK